MSNLPIADYALLSDCRSAALVSRGGSVDWLCFPRFDKPSVFGRLLDERAGHWSIAPAAEAQVSRRYIEGTMLLETTFRSHAGVVALVDGLAVGRNERGHELGADAPSLLLRRLVGVEGELELVLELAPRPEYGLIQPVLELVDGGLRARGGADVLAFSSSVPLDVDDFTARARLVVGAGDSVGFALHHRTTSEERPRLWDQLEISSRLDDTAEAWRTWSAMHQ